MDPPRITSAVAMATSALRTRLLRERVCLVPPALDGEVIRRLDLQLVRAARQALAERLQVHREDVAKALEAALAEEAMLVGPEAREVQHLGLVPPQEDIVGRGVHLV